MNPQHQEYDTNIVSTETKEEEVAPSEILPLELEDGLKSEEVGAAGAGVAAGAPPAKARQGGVCARHKGKFICLGVTLSLLVAAAVAIPLLFPKDPTATLLEQSNLQLSGLGTGNVMVDLRMNVQNPNRYPIAFQNLQLDIFDFNGVHIGEVTRNERFRVAGKSAAVMKATATLQPSFFEILAMGLDCLQNDNLTKLKVKGTADARFGGRTIKQEVGPFDQLTQCIATNINGQTTPPPPGVAPAGIGNGQIIDGIGQAISNGINNILGGGGGVAAVPAPGAAAGAVMNP